MKEQDIAKCQLLHPSGQKRCEKCSGRFLCFSRRFSPSEVKVSTWSFYVPNDEEGRQFLNQLKKYLNKNVWRIKKRGRAKNRKEKGGCQASQPLGTADYIAVYLHTTDLMNLIGGNGDAR